MAVNVKKWHEKQRSQSQEVDLWELNGSWSASIVSCLVMGAGVCFAS